MKKGSKRTLSRLELLRLAGAADTTREAAEGDDLLVLGYVSEIRVRLSEFETRQRRRDFTHVFEVRAQVLPAGLGG